MNSSCTCTPSESFDELKNKSILEIHDDPIEDWETFHQFAEQGNKGQGWSGWCFRGQTDWTWEISSSLEIAAKNIDAQKLRDQSLRTVEQGVIRRFQREYHQYRDSPPSDDDYIQWMSIMRHHGAPVRLVDVTYSIYVALFFAIRKCRKQQESAIWLLNNRWLDKAFSLIAPPHFQEEVRCEKSGRYINAWKILLNQRMRAVYMLNPFQIPLRLTRQRGGFLVPLDVDQPFMENLLGLSSCDEDKPWVIKQKLQFDANQLKKVFDRLVDMNSHASSLFPDLDGFSESLKMLMALRHHTDAFCDSFE